MQEPICTKKTQEIIRLEKELQRAMDWDMPSKKIKEIKDWLEKKRAEK